MINKIQIFMISIINLVSAIYAWIAIIDNGWIYNSLADPNNLIYISILGMACASALISLYFFLMLFHDSACECLTGKESNSNPSFSFCGCICNLILLASFVFGWIIFILNCNTCDSFWSSNYNNLWIAYIMLLSTPIAILTVVILFWIVRKCNKSNPNDHNNYRNIKV